MNTRLNLILAISRAVKPAVLLLIMLALLAAGAGASSSGTGPNDAQRGSIVLDGSPGVPVANPSTDTVYVPIQCKASFCSTPVLGHVLDVISAAHCNANVITGCRVLARVAVGPSPLDAVLDEQTDTIYVVNGTPKSGSVSVVNGARCNATVTSGCKRAVATIKTGNFTVAGALDPTTHTLYTVSIKGEVFVINVASCNAITTTGCRQRVRKVRDSGDPAAIGVDVATDTVYAANDGGKRFIDAFVAAWTKVMNLDRFDVK